MLQQVKQMLDEKGIQNVVKNQFASGAIGELSPIDAVPEIWIVDDSWLPKVNRMISELTARQCLAGPWRCSVCNEANEANFEICWQCGSEPQD